MEKPSVWFPHTPSIGQSLALDLRRMEVGGSTIDFVGADAERSCSRRRSVTDVGLPLAGTHRPGRMHRFYGNLRRICNFSMGRQSCRPLQQPFALSVGADDSVCPRDVPILRESSANSQLPPTSKEVTACGFAANSRRNSLHSAGRSRAPPLPTAVAFQRFLRKTNRLWS